MKCRHIAHLDCLKTRINGKWDGPRIGFKFLTCPVCTKDIETLSSPEVSEMLNEYYKLREIVMHKSMERLKIEGWDKDARLKNPEDPYFNKPQEYAMFKLNYYSCFKCQIPYFGGIHDCGQEEAK
jgi:hypothetical protein